MPSKNPPKRPSASTPAAHRNAAWNRLQRHFEENPGGVHLRDNSSLAIRSGRAPSGARG